MTWDTQCPGRWMADQGEPGTRSATSRPPCHHRHRSPRRPHGHKDRYWPAHGLVGGVLADRLPRRLLIQTCDVAAGLAQLAAGVLLIIGHARIWELLITAVLVAASTAASMPAAPALVAETVPADRRQRANGWLSIADSSAAFVGPLAAGLLVVVAGPGCAFLAWRQLPRLRHTHIAVRQRADGTSFLACTVARQSL